MRTRLLPLAALLGLAVACHCLLASSAAARAAAPDDKPALIIAVKSFDGLLADAKYLANVAGKDDDVKQLDETIKSLSGPDGLKGIDPKKPLGLYARLNAKDLERSEAVFLAPVADEKAVLDLLTGQGFKPEKGADGVYKIAVPSVPYPLYFTFADKYVYVAPDKAPLAKERRLAPEAVLPAESSSLLSVSARLDQVPDKYKDAALDFLQKGWNDALDKSPPPADDAEKKFRAAFSEQAQLLLKSVVLDGAALNFSLDVDRKAGELSASLGFSGRPDTKLAQSISELGTRKGVGAGLVGGDSAMHVIVNLALPEKLRQAFADVFEAGMKKALDEEKDAAKRQAGEAIAKAIGPTVRAGEFDGTFDLRGPGPQGHFALLMGARVKDGLEIEKLVRASLKDLPEKDRDKFKLDAAKAGGVSIHRGLLDENDLDADAKKMLGDNRELYFAFRDDAVLLAAGEGALDALKAVAAAPPKAGPVFEMQLAMARLAPFMADEYPAAPEVAKKVFKDKAKDRFRVAVEGGKALTVRLSMDAAVVAFGAALDEAGKKDK
jgi:hypothetical protein